MKIPFYLVRWEKFLTAIQYYISIYDFIEKILPINGFLYEKENQQGESSKIKH